MSLSPRTNWSLKKSWDSKKSWHFHCHCNFEHGTLVVTCQGHLKSYPLLDDMVEKCYCESAGPCDLSSSCVAKKIRLNF